jgi:pilus assembly protein TadC
VPTGPADVARAQGPTRRRRWLIAGAAGLAAGLLVSGLSGAVVAAVVTVLGERWLRARGDGRFDEPTALTRELPAACDLLGVCLSAGVAVSRLGADPRRAWADVPAELAALGRVLVRAGESGATAAPALRALAADSRASARAATEAAVQRAGVWVLAPLGACFLPAFVCLGVVPMVLGIAGDLFG